VDSSVKKLKPWAHGALKSTQCTMSTTIIDFWRAHPHFWIPVSPAEKAVADQEIYRQFWCYNYTKENYIGQIIYHDQFVRHFQRLLGSTVITEYDVENARHQAITQVCLHFDELKKADEVELVFACMPYKHTQRYDFIFTFIHNTWLPAQHGKTIVDFPHLHKFYMDTYTKAYTHEKIRESITVAPTAIASYDAALIADYYPAAYASQDNASWLAQIPVACDPCFKYVKTLTTPLIVSLSGGVDSMVMLAALKQMFRNNVVATHIIYGNRAIAEQEYNFIASYCKKLSVPLYVYRIPWLRRGAVDRDYYESQTRSMRFAVYKAVAELCGYVESQVCLGHIRDDAVENVWTNFAHGQHLHNLKKMQACETQMGVTICRPFLEMTKADIYAMSTAASIPYLKNTTPSWSNRGKFREHFYAATHAQFSASVDDVVLRVADTLSAQAAMLERLIYTPIYKSWNPDERTLDIASALTAELDVAGWCTIFEHVCHKLLGRTKPSIHAVKEFVRRLKLPVDGKRVIPMKKDFVVHLTKNILTFTA
jgi:tRNA(Ile)-lysidine synthetase-like protein